MLRLQDAPIQNLRYVANDLTAGSAGRRGF